MRSKTVFLLVLILEHLKCCIDKTRKPRFCLKFHVFTEIVIVKKKKKKVLMIFDSTKYTNHLKSKYMTKECKEA